MTRPAVVRTPGAQPRPLRSYREILDQRDPALSRSDFTHMDCLCLSPLAHDSAEFWVSSPNMYWTPEIPLHMPGDSVICFADGTYGKLDFIMWPQANYRVEPHCTAAPMHPRLCRVDLDDATGLAPAFGTRDDDGALPLYEDPEIAWCMIDETDVTVQHHTESGNVAMLRPQLLVRMRRAFEEVELMSGEGYDQRAALAGMSTSRQCSLK